MASLASRLDDLKRRTIVRVAGIYLVSAWAAFQVIKTLLEALEFAKWTITLALALLTMGLPVAIVYGWLLARNERAAGDKSGVRSDWVGALIVAAVVLIAAVIGWRWLSHRDVLEPAEAAATVPTRSIAVLPFVSFSTAAGDDFFADGLTEELINALAQGSSLKVAGRTSSFYFKGRNEDLRSVALRLGVAHVLEGSVRRSGGTIRITAQLIKAADGFHLWSQTFDRSSGDALAIQSEIAEAVARVLRTRLVGAAPVTRPRSRRDYVLELESRAQLRTGRVVDVQAARAGFMRLTEIEPANPAVWAGLAEAVMHLAQDHLALDFGEAARISAAALDRATKLDPDSAVVLRARGLAERVWSIRTGNTDHSRRAAAALARAVALDPKNADGLFLYGTVLASLGRHAEALDVLTRAIAIDPLNRGARTMVGVTLESLDRVADAERQYRATAQLFPDYPPPLISLAQLRVATGRLDEAIPPLVQAGAIDDDVAARLLLAYVYQNLGMKPEMDQVLAQLRSSPAAAPLATAIGFLADGRHRELLAFAERQNARDDDPIWADAIGMMGLLTGDYDKALGYFTKALPALFLPVPRADGARFDMMAAASALDGSGDHAQARRVLRLVLAVPASPGPLEASTVIARVNALAGLGQRDAAVAELRQSIARGFRTPYDFDMFTRIDRYPLMRSLANDGEFKALLAEIDRHNAVLRDRLRRGAARS